MGNTCCTNENNESLSKDEVSFSSRKERRMRGAYSKSENKLDEAIAMPCTYMNIPHLEAKLALKRTRNSNFLAKIKAADDRKSTTNQHGAFKYPDGSTYEGSFRRGMRHGFGKLVLANGSIYEGQFVNDKCHGVGLLATCDGNVYYGEWVDDSTQGYGEYHSKDGAFYRG